MRIAILQTNPICGDINNNIKQIIHFTRIAKKNNAILMLTSQIALNGYPLKDIILRRDFRYQIYKSIELLLEKINIPILFSAISLNYYNKKINTIPIYIKKQNITIHKKFSYKKNNEINCPISLNKNINFNILLDEQILNKHGLYSYKYINKLIEKKINKKNKIIIILSSYHFIKNEDNIRKKILKKITKKNNIIIVFINQQGGNDQYIFNNYSSIFFKNLFIPCSSKNKEELFYFDLYNKNKIILFINKIRKVISPIEMVINTIIIGIKDYIKKSKHSGVIIGLSGGIDSSLITILSTYALGPEKIIGFIMPSNFNSLKSVKDAYMLATKFNIKTHYINIKSIFQIILQNIEKLFINLTLKNVRQNLQARIRSIYLMSLANQSNHLLLSTGNKSESALGYSTMYGDLSGALSPISDIYKTNVYKISNYLNNKYFNCLYDVINKAPSAELDFNQKDEDDLPKYIILDLVLECFIEEDLSVYEIFNIIKIKPTIIKLIIEKIIKYEYKRNQSPPQIIISNRPFSIIRKWPLINKFNL